MLLTRRRFVSACAAGAVAVVPAPRRLPLLVPGLAAQAVALKDLVPRGWTIGAALNQNQSDGRRRSRHATVQHHHRFTFEAADRYVAFGRDRGMAVVGHNLVWHSQTPRWVWDDPRGARADRDTMLARMRTHITTVVGRYKGRIHGWDVVNEALNEDGMLRDSPWRQGIGDDCVAGLSALVQRRSA